MWPRIILALAIAAPICAALINHDRHEYCDGVLPQSNIPGTNLDTLSVIGGCMYFFMAFATLLFIRYSAKLAAQMREEQDDDVKSPIGNGEIERPVSSVIFPVFVGVLWAQLGISLFTGLIIATVPLDPGQSNSVGVSVLFASTWALQHGVIEGMAVLLQQKGCGWYASLKAMSIVAVYVLCLFWVFFFFFHTGNDFVIAQLVLDACLLTFYGSLWLLPSHRLFRRPALLVYAKVWFFIRILGVLLHVGLLVPSDLAEWVDCGYYFFRVLLFSLVQPLISYRVMYLDSLWWQGIDVLGATERPSNRLSSMSGDLTERPSCYSRRDFSLYNAQAVASVMDRIGIEENVRMLNFAYLHVHKGKLLGKGSFSTVYRGTYKRQLVAVKRIDTVDLTIDIIHRVASEASILSSIQNINVVGIYGVALMPPSIYIVLELCKYGSLGDIIRPSLAQGIPALNLSPADEIYLALGCARGINAVHRFSTTLCHRDVKSFNFLVDCQFNVKIADLELGVTKGDVIDSNKSFVDAMSWCPCFHQKMPDGANSHSVDQSMNSLTASLVSSFTQTSGLEIVHPVARDLLPMWLAPEVLKTGVWCQGSDIYALSMVFWELRSRRYPFENCQFNVDVQREVLTGYRHPFPSYPSDSVHAACYRDMEVLIQRGWAEKPSDRPSSEDIVRELEKILYKCCLNASGSGTKTAIAELHRSSIASSESGRSLEKRRTLSYWFQDHSGPWAIIEPTAPFNIRFKSDAWITSMQNIYSIASSPASRLISSEFPSLPESFADAGFFIPSTETAGNAQRGSQAKNRFIEQFSLFLKSILASRHGHIILSNETTSASHLNTSVEFSIHAFVIEVDAAPVQLHSEFISGSDKNEDVSIAQINNTTVVPTTQTVIGVIATDILELRRGAHKRNNAVRDVISPVHISSSIESMEIKPLESDEPISNKAKQVWVDQSSESDV